MNGSWWRRDRLALVTGLLVILAVVAVALGAGRPATAWPDDWRIEQYREVTFRVPADWGYGYEPGPDWCGHRGQQPGQQRQPYVMLGGPVVRLSIGCRPIPDSLITDHVAVDSADPRSWPEPDPRPDGLYRIQAGFWEAIRTVESLRLRAVSRDVRLAQRIVDSAVRADDTAPCDPDHPVVADPGYRPKPAADLETADRITLCQYEPDGGSGWGGVRAAGALTGADATKLIAGIAAAPVWDGPSCPAGEERDGPDVTVLLTVHSAAGPRELIMRLGSCENIGPVVTGGFDDGRTVRTATAETCRAVLTLPLRLDFGGQSVYERCRN
ncbi:hypothetical protein [Microlunatus parietis]|uniref:Uncharacterized protein n=1 Tax=Microlunatus parietis TaxID=682979 RepID=A0A7Y9I6N1_9ACTN|nr:hypothetical protein [Microlunatus parietis]NYE71257.1 hypothetical protein [Microlunatus parietis]